MDRHKNKLIFCKCGCGKKLWKYNQWGERHYIYTHQRIGRKHTEETKKRISEIKKKYPQRYWLGKKRDEATKQKISETKKLRFKWDKKLLWKARMALKNWAKNNPEEAKKHIENFKTLSNKPKNRKASSERAKRYFQGHPERIERQRKIAIKVRKTLSKGYETEIEKIIRKELKKRGIYFIPQKTIENFTIVDFLIPDKKIVIYCDGEYWHNKEGAKEKDRKQNKRLKKMGYKVFRFKGKEIKKNVEKLIDKLPINPAK